MAKLKLSDTFVEIEDPAKVQPVWIDVVTEIRDINGGVAISLGTLIADGDGAPTVRVATRLRMSYSAAQSVSAMLNDMLRSLTPKKGKTN
jgi:hypothetical protein